MDSHFFFLLFCLLVGLANSIWANPIIVVVALYLIGQEIGAAMWFAMLTLVSIMPVLIVVFASLTTLRKGIANSFFSHYTLPTCMQDVHCW